MDVHWHWHQRRHWHRSLLCILALAGVASPRSAAAQMQQSASQIWQVVRLTDGSIYQGDLVELVPGDHLTVRLATGEVKRFAWGDLQLSSMTLGAPEPQAPSMGLPRPFISIAIPPQPPQPPAETVPLHFQASDPQAILFSTRATGGIHFNNPGMNFDPLLSDWHMLCPRSPCDVEADRQQVYDIQGPGIVRSLPFTLPQSGPVVADVRVAHQWQRSLFTALTVLGSMSILGALVMFPLGAFQNTTPPVDLQFGTDTHAQQQQMAAQDKQHLLYTAGGVMLGGGAALMIAGIIGYVYSRTTVHFPSNGRLSLRLPGKAVLDLAPMQVRF